ncbi:unnamed protein product [Pleuronectes platessa]|uniref:Uncharacterized protein n=1 Tax=Pleuronectes platessa TaxID=8262 RepID=A0A9N7VZI1_PLEPL|nr:unnamed protein product [Pleuronectes platessa]
MSFRTGGVAMWNQPREPTGGGTQSSGDSRGAAEDNYAVCVPSLLTGDHVETPRTLTDSSHSVRLVFTCIQFHVTTGRGFIEGDLAMEELFLSSVSGRSPMRPQYLRSPTGPHKHLKDSVFEADSPESPVYLYYEPLKEPNAPLEKHLPLAPRFHLVSRNVMFTERWIRGWIRVPLRGGSHESRGSESRHTHSHRPGTRTCDIRVSRAVFSSSGAFLTNAAARAWKSHVVVFLPGNRTRRSFVNEAGFGSSSCATCRASLSDVYVFLCVRSGANCRVPLPWFQ